MSDILIVDDDKNLSETLSLFLTAKGYKVSVAESGEKAIDIIQKISFNAVLLDLTLEGMDGITALTKIKELDKEVPVIMVTGNKEIPNVIKSLKLGAFNYITKPFINDAILIVLEQ